MPLQQTSGAASYDAFGGGVAAVPKYIEDYFSTWLYVGNGASRTITNNIDLATKGGMVWSKDRSAAQLGFIQDTARTGANSALCPSLTGGGGYSNAIDSYTTSGYVISGTGNGPTINPSGDSCVSWSFAKAPKFFDVVTYTGDGTAGQTVAHNLGSFPGAIFVKATSTTGNWGGWVRTGSTAGAGAISLNSTAASAQTLPNSYVGDSTIFYPYWMQDKDTNIGNFNGVTYVAYLFAHNAGGFGLTGTDNVISCGSFTTDGSGNASVTLGYEPQWIMAKKTNATENWLVPDIMRGMSQTNNALLYPNSSVAEDNFATTSGFKPTATGFTGGFDVLSSSSSYIYIAIRRGPMKVPTSGTSVFAVSSGANGTSPAYTSNFPIDMYIQKGKSTGSAGYTTDRLRGADAYVETSSTAAETTGTFMGMDSNVGLTNLNSANRTGRIGWMFQRAPSTFDEVCYSGTGTTTTQTHNLQAVPELIIVKRRSGAAYWYVYSATYGRNYYAFLNDTMGFQSDPGNSWGTTDPTSTTFSLSPLTEANASGSTYVAYLWATNPGVTKVGSYTGNGSSQTINCGFTGGSRFVLIKRTNSSGDWYVWDSARGIVSGNDPHLSLNTTAAEVTTDDTIDTDSTGFIVNQVSATNCNVNGASYIFLSYA